MFPFQYLFFQLMTFSIMLAVSLQTWLLIWLMMEVSVFAFISMMGSGEYESALKYFFPQMVASSLLLFSFSYWSKLILFILCLKLGIFPLHFWVPSVMINLKWNMCFLLMSFQKVIPLFLIYSFLEWNLMFELLIISAMITSLQGLNQTSMRLIMSFSSMTYSSVMAFLVNFSATAFLMMFTFYINVTFLITALMDYSVGAEIMMYMLLLTLGGMPPLAGFFLKIVIFSFFKGMLWVLLGLGIGFLFSLYFYLKISYNYIMENGGYIKWESALYFTLFNLLLIPLIF